MRLLAAARRGGEGVSPVAPRAAANWLPASHPESLAPSPPGPQVGGGVGGAPRGDAHEKN